MLTFCVAKDNQRDLLYILVSTLRYNNCKGNINMLTAYSTRLGTVNSGKVLSTDVRQSFRVHAVTGSIYTATT